MTLLSGDWPTDWIIYSWFIHRLTDSLVTGSLFDQIIVFTVQELTNWLNNSIDWLNIWLYCPGTDQVTEWFTFIYNNIGWLVDWLINWLYCPGTDQLTEWFMAGLLVDQLTPLYKDWPTHWMIYSWLIYWISDSTVQGLTIGPKYNMSGWLSDYLTLMSGNLPTDWMIYCWLIDWIPDSTVQGLTNWLNDLLLIDCLTTVVATAVTLTSGDWPTDSMRYV